MALSIENIDEQFITLGTEDYDLVIDIGGNPDDVFPSGLLEGFTHHWDASNGQLHIKSDEVTRLLAGVNWDVEAIKGMQNLTRQIAYNVVRAAPIFETLETIHLYRGVDINFDIMIQNIPSLLIPDAYLVGLKSDLVEYGINIQGRMATSDNFTFTSGNIEIIVPSGTEGEDDTVHEYPFEIESGSPPVLGDVDFLPKGNYGEITFNDVTDAFGYEWTLEEGDGAEWNTFSESQPLINPGEVEVTPGDLQITIKFPNIDLAERYEYMLESDTHTIGWRPFTGTLANSMITTIIPGLEDTVEYTLRLRVASPWIGTPIELTVTGGRIAYSVHDDGADSYLYVFHTGVPDGGTATRIKRILLPTGLTAPYGVAIHGNRAYVTNAGSPNSVYVFNHANFDDGDRATVISEFTEISSTYRLDRPIAVFGDRLYAASRFRVDVYDRNSTNGQNITLIESIAVVGGGSSFSGTSTAATEHSFSLQALTRIYVFERGSLTPSVDFDFSDRI